MCDLILTSSVAVFEAAMHLIKSYLKTRKNMEIKIFFT